MLWTVDMVLSRAKHFIFDNFFLLLFEGQKGKYLPNINCIKRKKYLRWRYLNPVNLVSIPMKQLFRILTQLRKEVSLF